MIHWAIPNHLARSPRPGHQHNPARKGEVDTWIKEAKSMGIKSVICLLSDQELYECYTFAKIDLIAGYKKAGFEVIHFPVSDYITKMYPEQLRMIHEGYVRLPKPCLVHCNAGVTRTGQVVEYLNLQKPGR